MTEKLNKFFTRINFFFNGQLYLFFNTIYILNKDCACQSMKNITFIIPIATYSEDETRELCYYKIDVLNKIDTKLCYIDNSFIKQFCYHRLLKLKFK